jgi:pyruvate ferredoxin oxidoreductase gamma subunit
MAPDALIVQDATLLHQVDVFAGLRPEGYLLVNSTRTAAELGITTVVARLAPGRVAIVAASRIAVEHLGRPMPGVALLGAFAALTGQISVASIDAAVHEQFTGATAAGNAAAARAAFDVETASIRQGSRAAC